MRDIILPVVLTLVLGPGVGQLYNREFRKGSYFIVAALVLAGFMMGLGFKNMLPPAGLDIETMDPAALEQLTRQAQAALSPAQTPLMGILYGATVLLWIWATVDAYLGAKKRRLAKTTLPVSTGR